MEEDAPYWYTERTLVGTLATAAWQVEGCTSLEEYTVEKGRGKPKGMGRADLWIQTKDGRRYVFEAKRLWQNIGSRAQLNKIPENYEELLAEAKEKARKIREEGERLGLLFASTRLREKEREKVDERIEAFLSELKKVDADAVAWIFPSKDLKYEGWIYPGPIPKNLRYSSRSREGLSARLQTRLRQLKWPILRGCGRSSRRGCGKQDSILSCTRTTSVLRLTI